MADSEVPGDAGLHRCELLIGAGTALTRESGELGTRVEVDEETRLRLRC